MTRVWLGIGIAMAFACGGAGASAPDINAPISAPAASLAPKMPFTRWHLIWIGQDISNDLTFLPDGTISDENHPEDKNTWKVDGDKIHMTYNEYVTYEGEFIDGFTMGGTYVTGDGSKGNWKASRSN